MRDYCKIFQFVCIVTFWYLNDIVGKTIYRVYLPFLLKDYWMMSFSRIISSSNSYNFIINVAFLIYRVLKMFFIFIIKSAKGKDVKIYTRININCVMRKTIENHFPNSSGML